MTFESELYKGNFTIAECDKCKKIVWPPSEFCNNCFNQVIWRKGPCEGKIIEFSKKNNEYFCLIEIENHIKVIGKMTSGIPIEGNKIKIDKCGIRENNYFFEISLI